MTGAARNAGFWRRAAALAVDALWLFCLIGVIGLLLTGRPWPAAGHGVLAALAATVGDLLPLLVCVIGWGRFAATPGKCLLDLRVVDDRTGERPGYVRALVRYIGYFVSALPLGLGFVWIVVDRERRALHDHLAGTRVIRVADEALLDIDPASVT